MLEEDSDSINASVTGEELSESAEDTESAETAEKAEEGDSVTISR